MKASKSVLILATAMLVSAPALSGPDAAVSATLERARAAMRLDSRPAEGVRATGVAHYRGTEVPFTLTFDGRSRFVAEFGGPLPLVQGFDGARAWERESGSPERALDLGDRDSALLSNWFVTGAWAMPGSPLEFAPAASGVDAPEGAGVLSFSMRGSPLVGSVVLAPGTNLVQRATWSAGERTTTQEMSGYAERAGVLLPTSVVQTATDGEPIRIRIDSASAAARRAGDPFAAGSGRPADTTFRADVPVALEVKRAPTGHLLVHPTLGGRDLGWFIFDTGAGSNVLSTPVAEEAGYEAFGSVKAVGVGGSTEAHFYRAPDMTLGPVTIRDAVFVGIDLSFLDQYMGVRVAGVVGYELLSRVVAEFDITAGAISIHDPATRTRDGAAWMPLLLYQRHPCVSAQFEGGQGVFNLDTGAAQTWVSFHAPAVERLGLLDGRATTASQVGGVGGALPARSGVIDWIEVGGRRFEAVQATFATEAKGAFADAYLVGSVGGRLMAPFVLVLDYPGKRIAFVERED